MRQHPIQAADERVVTVRRVLCPIDFSEAASRALDHAVPLARWYGAELHVLHVEVADASSLRRRGPAGGLAGRPTAHSPAHLAELQHQVQALAASRTAALPRPAEITIGEGDPVEQIVREAGRADLVVMGAHGRAGVDRRLLGSVAERVLRQAPCPVLTVPLRSRDATHAVPSLFHDILAAIDFSDDSQPALDYAVSLAVEADAHLTLLHVRAAAVRGVGGGDGHGEGSAIEARHRLASMVPSVARVYCHVDEQVESGEPAHEILRVAADRGSALIVMGSHGGGAAGRLFTGSTTERVIREAACAVLAMRAAQMARPG